MGQATGTGKVHRYDDPTPGAWDEFITAMHSGETFECDRAMYWYWLEVLPPAWMGRTIGVEGRTIHAAFGFAEGEDYVTAFWIEAGRYFGRRTDEINVRGW